ncbi:molybdate ABC transporter substrate-binding protein [Acetobacterium sp.]|jgi:molybdate transport system substrate-binding protein|uniref:molybdate ABC transporter substrate-binding protein n=1 Tax=Acetobacterium sp. TaxID=1872094 RepID=UPI000CC329D0|nr:molybdate ABC transporter substrate-binding protein [Acetobacterium sp.]MDO9492546.1 molybdate ABC transporter substrate-binding protein [Acetobacterium sp.]PKM75217.1 MAG: molybdate ABC transporter substrate-binding protein [Firmicutes bacterium HGW-Firmicutes-17]
MKLFKKGIVLIALLSMVFALAGCQPAAKEEAKSEPVALTISAAASLKDAMAEIQTLYLKEAPDTTLTLNFGSSGSLAQQIQQGAEVDVFMSASSKEMNNVKDAGFMNDNTVKNILGNEIVLVVPKDSTTTIADFAQVVDPAITKLALGEPSSVPAGQYAVDVFTYYNVMDQISDKVIYGKDVKEVLTWVETGNVDAGVVYSTDAKISKTVKIVATAPPESHKAIVYPAGVVKASTNADAASAFVDFLSTAAAKEIFVKYGFTTL